MAARRRIMLSTCVLLICIPLLSSCGLLSGPSVARGRYVSDSGEIPLYPDDAGALIGGAAVEDAIAQIDMAPMISYCGERLDQELGGMYRFVVDYEPTRTFESKLGKLHVQQAVLATLASRALIFVKAPGQDMWDGYSVPMTEPIRSLLLAMRHAYASYSTEPTVAMPVLAPTTEPALQAASAPDPMRVMLAVPNQDALFFPPVLTWVRVRTDSESCEKLLIGPDGSVTFGYCQDPANPSMLPPGFMDTFEKWRAELAPFTFEPDPNGSELAGWRIELAWYGQGTREPTPGEIAAIVMWSTHLHNVLQQPKG